MADLFATEEQAPRASESPAGPLADRLRPQRLEDVVGQEHLTGAEG
ncbi:MAG: replication-associated recombination protein A, partial [Proteobacteria bacterium]|nr:replication-associated recombination protein A [Pseudomonadota bacterium]